MPRQLINFEPVSWFFVFEPTYLDCPIVQEFSYSQNYTDYEIKSLVNTYLVNMFRKLIYTHIIRDNSIDYESWKLQNNKFFYATNLLKFKEYAELPKQTPTR